LKDIISAYPGISLAEAAQRLNAHNSAIALGLPPPSLPGVNDKVSTGFAAPFSVPSLGVSSIGGVLGEGGAVTKPHREL
jgi:hypothetical protein